MALSKDGSTLVSAGSDSVVRWSVSTGAMLVSGWWVAYRRTIVKIQSGKG